MALHGIRVMLRPATRYVQTPLLMTRWQASKATTASSSSAVTVQRMEHRAFMSTRSPYDHTHIFSEPSFPIPNNNNDPSVWLEKYTRMDPSHMWKVGSFPLQDADELSIKSGEEGSVLSCTEDLWDTSGMLSALSDNLPLREAGSHPVDELLRELDMAHGYFADSVLKKRRKKMNKHKHKKRKKALRMRTKKN